MAAKKALIRDGKTVEQMVRAIADGIVVGTFRPGDKLDEMSLAGTFAVSRTPVREALGQLAVMGLVDRRPNRGAIVAVVTRQHLASMFESMAELEAMCARFAATRMTSEERTQLERNHHGSSRLVSLALEEEYEVYNFDFHSCLYRGAHNDHIMELALSSQTPNSRTGINTTAASTR